MYILMTIIHLIFMLKYGEYEMQVMIRPGKVYAGKLPGKQKEMVLEVAFHELKQGAIGVLYV